MYPLNTRRVNFDTEILAMSQYIDSRWDCPVNLGEVFTAVQQRVAHDARFVFDADVVWNELVTRRDRREALLKKLAGTPEEKENLPSHDNSRMLLGAMADTVHVLWGLVRNIDGVYLIDRCSATYKELSRKYPDLKDARPKGWKSVKRNDDELDLMEKWATENQSAEEAAFAGAATPDEGGVFVFRTSLPSILREKRDARQSPPAELVFAAYAHLHMLKQYQNTCRLIEELQSLPLRDTEQNPVFDLVEGETRHPLVAAMFILGNFKFNRLEDYQKALEEDRAYAKLPAAQRKAEQAQATEAVRSLLADIRNPHRKPSPSAKEFEAREEKCLQFLKTLAVSM